MALRPRVRRLISKHGNPIPRSLDGLIQHGDEAPLDKTGMGSEQVAVSYTHLTLPTTPYV